MEIRYPSWRRTLKEVFEIVRDNKTEVGLDAWRRLNHKNDPRNPLRNIWTGCSRRRKLTTLT